MLKKVLLVLLLFVLGNFVFAAPLDDDVFEKRLMTVRIPNEVDFKQISLAEALTHLSKASNVNITATPEIADIKLELYFPANQTIRKFIDTIKSINGLVEEIQGDTLFLSKRKTSSTSDNAAFKKRLMTVRIPNEVDFKQIALGEALTNLSKASNVTLVAAADIVDIKLDLYFPANQTVRKIVDTIKSTNGLVEEIRVDTLILMKRPAIEEPLPHILGKVVGKITEIDKITGIRGVTLTLGDDMSTLVLSDVGGAYIIDNIKPGSYILKAVAKGYNSNAEIIEIKSGEDTKVNMILAKAAGKLGAIGNVENSYLVADKSGSKSVGPFYSQPYNTEEYSKITENTFQNALKKPLSTFSIDVDKASYANVRRSINNNSFPQKDAVRVEEVINYFDYDYPIPTEQPFSVTTELSDCPWNSENKLLLIGIKGKEIKEKINSNLVFLIDVSGSMSEPNKLPLVKDSLRLLVNSLKDNDTVSIVVYAGSEGLALPATSGKEKEKILSVIDNLQSGGSTAGGAGINLAYKIAKENFLQEGNNRVILATDGDFNVGISSTSEMVKLIEEKRKEKIFLTILGFGNDNLKDSRMEEMADKGDGNYFYIDNILEAKKVFIDELKGTLFTIAKDVKLQAEFNPAFVESYKLVGYENRVLKTEDFKNDKKDAGDLGSGHTVTALYEIVLNNKDSGNALKYQNNNIKESAYTSNEIMTLNLRYKKPEESKSNLLSTVVMNNIIPISKTSNNFKLAAAAAEFGMLLRDSDFKGSSSWDSILTLAKDAKGLDKYGYRAEFISLVEKCKLMR